MPPKQKKAVASNLPGLDKLVGGKKDEDQKKQGGKKEDQKKQGGKKEDQKKQGGKKDVVQRRVQKGGCGCSEMLVHP